ncbi:MAG UNVERIFIED_CONTAM: GNAT family N-acetyltransferase [Anaerolineae bacterium]|jgi:putative acetyltransferase
MITIIVDDLSSEESQTIVREHMAGMLANTPIESVHALPLDNKLRRPNVTFWTAWIGSELCGCGALQTLDSRHGEVKTMRTRSKFLRQSVGQQFLHIIEHATEMGIKRLNLETGSSDAFLAARSMYLKNGFEICGPFGDDKLDPHSVFMCKDL